MQNRRDFLKTAAFAALGSGMAINNVFAGESAPALSLSRIRILFVDGKSILISPKDRSQFLDLLYSVNDKIKM
mgnify:CR=1 FL=1